MKTGVVFPQTEIGSDPAVLRDWVQAAEALGYEHVLIYDHVLGAVHEGREPRLIGPYTEATAFHEPFVTLSYFAAATSRIALMTGVIILPQRQAALVAKQAAQVDILSGGRLRLGIGTGWNHVEYEALGVPWAGRGRRQEEQVELMRRLWTEPVVDFTGRYHRVDRAGIQPLPARSIPIWFGGFADAVIDRAARLGDGYLAVRLNPGLPALWEKLRARLTEVGRDPAEFGFETGVQYGSGPAAWGSEAEEARSIGATLLSVNTMGAGLAGPRDHIDALRAYAEATGVAAAG